MSKNAPPPELSPSSTTSLPSNHAPRTLPPSNNYRTSNSDSAFDFSITKISCTEARKLLGVRTNFTKREVVLRHRMLARKHRLDNLNSSVPHSKEVSSEKFKIISNAKDALISSIRNDCS